MSVEIIAALIILLLFALFVVGVEIGFAMALTGFIGFGVMVNFRAALDLVAMDFYSVFSSYGLIVIPLFVFMGQIGASAGLSKSLYDLGYKCVGHISGGLAIATVIWRRPRPYPPGHCQKCGYSLLGNVSGRCPECGTPTTVPKQGGTQS